MPIIDTHKIIVPNWFDKKDLEDLLEKDILLEDFEAFRDWLWDGNLMNDVSELVREYYNTWVDEKLETEPESKHEVEQWEERWHKGSHHNKWLNKRGGKHGRYY